MFSIKYKLLFLLLIISLIPMTIIGYINYNSVKNNLINTVQKNMFTVVETRKLAFEKYIDDTESMAKSIANTDIVQEYLTTTDAARKFVLGASIQNLLYAFQTENWGKYHHFFIIDDSKEIVLGPNHGIKLVKGSPSSHVGEDTSRNPWVREAFVSKQTTISDFSSWVESDHNHQMMFYPIQDTGGNVHGVMGIELQIPYELDILTKDINLGETAKAFFVTTLGKSIAYKISESGKNVVIRGIETLKRTGSYSGTGMNSQGVAVYDFYLRHKKYPWILGVEVEASEVLKDLEVLKKKFLFIFLIAAIVVFLLAFVFSYLLVKPLKQLANDMESVSRGNFELEMHGLNRRDEVGTLVTAFGRVVKSLEILMRSKYK